MGVGGALGAISRYGVSQAAELWLDSGFPYGTLAVNTLGSFGFGLVSGAMQTGALAAPWGHLLLTGFFGGFTTFSAFSNDVLGLFQSGDWWSTTGYVVGSVGLAVGALMTGQALMGLMLL